jgi:hypothetical protein
MEVTDLRHRLRRLTGCVGTALVTMVLLLALPTAPPGAAQARLAAAKSIRCSFPQNATGAWNKAGAPEVTPKPSTLVLRFEAIDADDGTAQLRNGSMSSDVIVRASAGYLHFMQVFRTGPLYTTTVFDKDADGRLKAVHSRHEYFPQPLPGATSSPEQYYGECDVVP